MNGANQSQTKHMCRLRKKNTCNVCSPTALSSRWGTTFFLFCFWLRKFVIGSRNEPCHEIGIIHTINQKMGFCAGIWRSFFTIRINLRSCCCLFYKELIITDHADNFSVAIDPIFTKHFFVCNLSGTADLCTHIFHEIQTGSHDFHLPLFQNLHCSIRFPSSPCASS